MHLLVIEDERALCETIVRSLRRLAYSVDYCYDGEKALALLGVERYDLVLLDLNLPKKDGMTVLRTLRQTDRETRVLILSARSEVEDKVQGLDAGANDYLAKPFHLAELEARIRSLTLPHASSSFPPQAVSPSAIASVSKSARLLFLIFTGPLLLPNMKTAAPPSGRDGAHSAVTKKAKRRQQIR